MPLAWQARFACNDRNSMSLRGVKGRGSFKNKTDEGY